MSQFKLDSQPFQPSIRSRHVQKRMAAIKTVYSSHYLKLLKEYNKDLPQDCSQELLDSIRQSQQEDSFPESMQSNSLKSSNSSQQQFSQKSSQKSFQKSSQKQPQSHSYRAQFTSKKRSDAIERLVPTTKPIPIHHPSLLQASSSRSTSSSSSSSYDSIEILKPIESNEKNAKEKRSFHDEYDNEMNELTEPERDEKRKHSREKQIYFGKSTKEYQNYLAVIPKEERLISDPQTPDIEAQVSKRKWDKVVRRWRRSLHAFDTVDQQNQVELARALALRLQNERDPKKKIMYYSSVPYSSYLLDEE